MPLTLPSSIKIDIQGGGVRLATPQNRVTIFQEYDDSELWRVVLLAFQILRVKLKKQLSGCNAWPIWVGEILAY